jgi:hypothetical protein
MQTTLSISSHEIQALHFVRPAALDLGLEQELLPNDGVDGSRSRRCQDEPVCGWLPRWVW